MHISISTSAYDVISIQMEHRMKSYLYSLVRQIPKDTNHTFGLARKLAREQVIYRVESLNVSNVGERIDPVVL